jgi:hypothetical protein
MSARGPRWLLLTCAALLPACAALCFASGAASASGGKFVVYCVAESAAGLEATAEAAGIDTATALGALPDITASAVQPTAAVADQARWLSAGEVAPRIASATGADVVVLVGVTRCGLPAPYLLGNVAFFDSARGEIDLASPVRMVLDDPGALQRFSQALGAVAAAWARAWAFPRGEVIEVRPVAPRQEVRVRLDRALPPSERGYNAERLGPPLVAAATGEHFTAEGVALGRVELLNTEGDGLWLSLSDRVPLSRGARVRLLPADAASTTAPGGPTLVVTSRPWGAVTAVSDEVFGLTPARVPLPSDDAPLSAMHPLAMPWRRAVPAEARAAGLLVVPLQGADGMPPGVTGQSVVKAAVRIESDPSGSEVLIDGVPKGTTPVTLPDLSGAVDIVVRRAGYKTWTSRVVVDGPLSLRAQLQALCGTLRIVSAPPGAPVTLDGRKMGVTPLELTHVPVGEHEVSIAGNARTILVKADESLDVSAGGTVPTPRPATPAPAPVISPSPSPPVTPVEPAPVAVAPAVVAASAHAPFEIERLLWERQTTLASGGIYVALTRLRSGLSAVSVSIAPEQAGTLAALPDGFAVDFPEARIEAPVSWPKLGNALFSGVRLEPLADGKGLRVKFLVADGVSARMHESSRRDNLRFVLIPPTTAP